MSDPNWSIPPSDSMLEDAWKLVDQEEGLTLDEQTRLAAYYAQLRAQTDEVRPVRAK